MSVGVFPFMLQSLVYVRVKLVKIIRVSSVPSNTNASCKERREAIVFTGNVI